MMVRAASSELRPGEAISCNVCDLIVAHPMRPDIRFHNSCLHGVRGHVNLWGPALDMTATRAVTLTFKSLHEPKRQ